VRPFIGWTAALLLLIVAVNAIAALDGQAHEQEMRAAAARFGPGQALLGYRDTDERRFQRARLAVIPRPRLVAFGSSLVMEVSTEMVGAAPGEFYNAGMSGGTVEDWVVLWSVLKRGGRVPETALFSVDDWAFNLSHPQVRWLVWADEVTRFVETAGGRPAARGLPVDGALYRWYQAKEFLSFTVLRRSLRELDRRRIGRAWRGSEIVEALQHDLVPETEVAGRRALRADGSLLYDRTYLERPAAEIREEALRFATVVRAGLGDFQWDAARAERLELLWRDMRAHGVRLVAWLPPYHPAVWTRVAREPRSVEALAATDALLRALARRAGARYVDFSNPATVPCAEAEFLDGNHARASCMARIVRRVLAGAAPADRLTPVEPPR
jgi:hypothetical protein